jgi:phage protein D
MRLQAFCKVRIIYAGGFMDISERIESFKFRQSIKKDNILELKIKKDYVPNLIDDKNIVNGNVIMFHWGFVGGSVSRVHRVRLQDPVTSYGERVSLTIKGIDVGNTMKKSSIQDVYGTSQTKNFEAEILKPIADKYGLKLKVSSQELKTINSDSIGPISGRDELNYLRGIALSNNFMCYVDSDMLVFKKRDLAQKSSKTFVYGDGKGTVISFNPQINETTSGSTTGNTAINSVDPLTGKTNNVVGLPTETSLGKYTPLYNEDAIAVGENKFAGAGLDGINGNKKNIPTPDATYSATKANKLASDLALKQITADLSVLGDPLIETDKIITMAGVSKKDSGNWYVEEISHSFSASEPYITTFSLNKNATASPSIINADEKNDVNKSTGPDKSANSKEVPQYDQNGNLINPLKSFGGTW